MKYKIFVYGTLLSGQFRNHHFLGKSNFLGPAKTLPIFDLRFLGNFPGLVMNGDTVVHGEVYEIDSKTLAAMDKMEGHPHNYRRTMIRVEVEDSSIMIVDAYVLSPDLDKNTRGFPIITSGDWRSEEVKFLRKYMKNLVKQSKRELYRNAHVNRGFTLLELLITVAIVGILMVCLIGATVFLVLQFF
jgi:gamma-glutamylaminecyclotransferase